MRISHATKTINNERLKYDDSQTLYKESLKQQEISTENSSLLLAFESGNILMVRLLLKRGADIGGKSEDGKSPLHVASMKGNEELVRLCLD